MEEYIFAELYIVKAPGQSPAKVKQLLIKNANTIKIKQIEKNLEIFEIFIKKSGE